MTDPVTPAGVETPEMRPISAALREALITTLDTYIAEPVQDNPRGIFWVKVPMTIAHELRRALAALPDAPPTLDVERLVRAFQKVQPGVYGIDWPDDDPYDFQFVDPRDHARAIAAEYARLAPERDTTGGAEK